MRAVCAAWLSDCVTVDQMKIAGAEMTDAAIVTTKEKLGIGEITGDTFAVFFGNFIHVLLLSLLPTIVIVVAALLLGARYFLDPTAFENISAIDITFMVLLGVIAFSAIFFTTALIVRLAYDARAGNPLRIGSYFGSAFSSIVPVVGCSIIITICALAAMFLFVLTAAMVGGAVAVIFFILAFLAFLYIYAMWTPVIPAIVVENVGFGGLGRSLELTRGFRWACVGALVVMLLCLSVISFVLGIGQVLLTAIGGEIAGMIFAVIFNGVSMAFYGIFAALLYARLREIKEGTSVAALADVFA